jgi:hypothetical protein
MATIPVYPFDATGVALQNKVIGESYQLYAPSNRTTVLVVPLMGPFYWNTIEVKYVPNTGPSRILNREVDYKPVFQYLDATSKTNQLVVGGFQLTDSSLVGTGQVMMNYQCLGGLYVVDPGGVWARAWQVVAYELRDAFFTTWEQAAAKAGIPLPDFPVVDIAWSRLNAPSIQRMLTEMEQAGLVVSVRQKLLPSPDTVKFVPDKTEIGLGNLANLPLATDTEAINDTLNNRYMTPHSAALAATQVLSTKLALMGYKVPTAYAAGLTVTDATGTFTYQNDVYAPRSSALPFTTSGLFEKEKFLLVRSADRDHWHNFSVITTGSEPRDTATGARVIETGIQFDSAVKSQLILNGVVEMTRMVDYHLSGSKIILEYPCDAGTEVRLLWRRSSSTVADDRPFYQSFLVDSGINTFTLTNFGSMVAEDFRVTLSDWSILTLHSDYEISAAGVLKITFPLKLGDLIEVENNDMVPDIGKFQLRSILSATV